MNWGLGVLAAEMRKMLDFKPSPLPSRMSPAGVLPVSLAP